MNLKELGQVGPTIYYLRKDGVIHTVTTDPQPIQLDLMIANFEFIKTIAIERKQALRMLTDFSGSQKMGKAERDFLKSEQMKTYAPYILGTALVTPNFLSRMIGNFVISVSTNNHNVKLFGQEEQAVHWLLQLPSRIV